jgi:hypothetical protein
MSKLARSANRQLIHQLPVAGDPTTAELQRICWSSADFGQKKFIFIIRTMQLNNRPQQVLKVYD